uniref:Cadherin 18 n=1 Tax=Gadus morhua TaxID=8049 RepID=A0A8C5BHM2_GADMO
MRIASSSRGYLPPFLVCLCFIQRCYGASHHHPPPAKVPSRNGTRLRGWIWNQFFVLEEHIGPESQYVGKLHSNSDKGDGSVRYILSGEGAGTIFIIDEVTGDIHAAKSLDRERKSHYVLHAQALDRYTEEALEPKSEFIIKVQDINDNAPKFPEGPFVVKKEPLIFSEEDVRENVVTYDDEGGGEEDTEAFDIAALRNPAGGGAARGGGLSREEEEEEEEREEREREEQRLDAADVHEFIKQKLVEADLDASVPPYDSLQTYAYEGGGSPAGSISSLDSPAGARSGEGECHLLDDWGPAFQALAGLCGEARAEAEAVAAAAASEEELVTNGEELPALPI